MTDNRQKIDMIEQSSINSSSSSNSKPSESTNLQRFETTNKQNKNIKVISRPVSKLAAKVKADAKRLAKAFYNKNKKLEQLNSNQSNAATDSIEQQEEEEEEEEEEMSECEMAYYLEDYPTDLDSSGDSMSNSFVEDRLSALGMLPWVKNYY